MINLCKKEDLNLLSEYPKEVVENVNNVITILNESYGDNRKLGKRLTVDGKPTISLLYICGYPSLRHGPSINYEALKNCIITANAEFKGKKVMTTMIGSAQAILKGIALVQGVAPCGFLTAGLKAINQQR